jgi:hypothetical protein
MRYELNFRKPLHILSLMAFVCFPSAGLSIESKEATTLVARAILYEEDPNNPTGKRFEGSVLWRNETV